MRTIINTTIIVPNMNKFLNVKLINVPIKDWFNRIAIVILILMTKSLCACNTTKEMIKRINFDSVGIPLVMDNSPNCHTCSDKS